MGPKLLFFIGIVAAHAALGAVWVQEEAKPGFRTPIASCTKNSGPPPDFTPRRELLAMAVSVEMEAVRP